MLTFSWLRHVKTSLLSLTVAAQVAWTEEEVIAALVKMKRLRRIQIFAPQVESAAAVLFKNPELLSKPFICIQLQDSNIVDNHDHDNKKMASLACSDEIPFHNVDKRNKFIVASPCQWEATTNSSVKGVYNLMRICACYGIEQ